MDLLFNRILGQLLILADFGSGDQNVLEHAFYHNGKVVLDLAAALLILLNEYQPTNQQRLAVFNKVFLDTDCAPLRQQLSHFQEKLTFWTQFKIMPSEGALAQRFSRVIVGHGFATWGLRLWLELVDYLRCFWIWASNRLLSGKWTDDLVTLAERHIQIERDRPSRAKFEAWQTLARHPCVRQVRFSKLKMLRLFRDGTPLSLAKICGTLLYFSSSSVLRAEIDSQVRKMVAHAGRYVPAGGLGLGRGDISSRWWAFRDNALGVWRLYVQGHDDRQETNIVNLDDLRALLQVNAEHQGNSQAASVR
jgi:hypothetical protein